MTENKKINSTDCVRPYPDGVNWDMSLILPLLHSAPFKFTNTAELIRYQESKQRGFSSEYGRIGNPTVRAVEAKIATLDNAEDAALFASGMSAVTTAMLHLLANGDHVVITIDSYKRTRDFLGDTLGKFGVTNTVVPVDADAMAEAVTEKTRLIFTESPTNPNLNVIDLEKMAALGKVKNITTMVDCTFGTPVNVRPLDYGIDLVAHSCTKYLGGHNDLIAGSIAGPKEIIDQISDLKATVGGVCAPETAYLLDRGIKTLCLRVEKQNSSGQKIAEHLESHPKIERVFYPGLSSHPHHEIARRQMSGFGGVVSFLVKGDFKSTAKFVDALRLPAIAPSLGGVESLVEQPMVMGYWDMPREERERFGLLDNLVRYSVGVEEAEELIADIDHALDVI